MPGETGDQKLPEHSAKLADGLVPSCYDSSHFFIPPPLKHQPCRILEAELQAFRQRSTGQHTGEQQKSQHGDFPKWKPKCYGKKMADCVLYV